jgi:RNA polymerase sigma-70 factor (ECF subfamily)
VKKVEPFELRRVSSTRHRALRALVVNAFCWLEAHESVLPMTRLSPIPNPRTKRSASVQSNPVAAVVHLRPPARSDEDILRGMRAGEAWAAAALLDRHGPLVERIVRRILGHDQDLQDLVHDAFATILASIHQVRDDKALRGWIISVAANTAHHTIRRRKLTRLIFFWQTDNPPEIACEMDLGAREAVRRTYAALDQLPAAERVAFALRFIDEMPLEDVAQACNVSLATIKRRIASAEQRFTSIARRDPVLRTWLEGGRRWT